MLRNAVVVARLADSLLRSIAILKTHKTVVYALFMDNLFSTPELFSMLRERYMAPIGTVCSSVGGFPKCLYIWSTTDMKLPWNKTGVVTCPEQKVLAPT